FAASANSSRPISSLCRWSSRGIAQAVRLSATGCVTCVGCGELLAVTGSCVLKRRMILTSAVAPTSAFVSHSGAVPSGKVCSSSCASMSTTDRNTAMLNQLVSDIHHGFTFTTMVSCMASASVVGARAHQYAQLSDRLRQHLHLAAQPGKPLAAVLTQRLQLNLQLAGHVFSRVGARHGHFGDALRSSHTLADAVDVLAHGAFAGLDGVEDGSGGRLVCLANGRDFTLHVQAHLRHFSMHVLAHPFQARFKLLLRSELLRQLVEGRPRQHGE